MSGTDGGQHPDIKAVAEAVRRSRLLDPVVKKRWLELLPHMSLTDRLELWSIVTEGEDQLSQLDIQPDAQR